MDVLRGDDAAVRRAVQEKKGPLFIAAPCRTNLDDCATEVYRGAPDELARLGFAVAHALNPEAPAAPDAADEMRSLAERIAGALKGAKQPLIISGTSCGSESIIQAATNVAWSLSGSGRAPQLSFVVPECNSMGLGLMGGSSIDAG